MPYFIPALIVAGAAALVMRAIRKARKRDAVIIAQWKREADEAELRG